jgi:regulator of chromosome condensation
MGFRPEGKKGDVQRKPMLIPELKNIVDIATGTNHVLALDTKGKLYVWGTGEQNQLGRRVIERTSRLALRPADIGLRGKKIIKIGSGDYHSFAVDNKDNLYSWGLNSFGQTGIPKIGKDEDIVGSPTLVKSLQGFKLKQVTGGSHHTIACTADGQVLKWGRVESSEAGFDCSNLPDDEVYKENDKARYLKKPKAVPGLQGAIVATANDTCIVVTPEGTAYSWGFSEGYQTGLGIGGEIKLATLIDNTAVRAENLIWCGVGGQFGVLGGIPKEDATNKA